MNLRHHVRFDGAQVGQIYFNRDLSKVVYIYEKRRIYVNLGHHVRNVVSCLLGSGMCTARSRKYRSLFQNIVSFIGLFCKRDL